MWRGTPATRGVLNLWSKGRVAGENTRPCAVLRQVASERMRRRGTIATNGGV